MNTMATPDHFDFHHRIGDTHGPALVLFRAPGCASCRHWTRLLADYAGLHGNVTLYRVDVQRDMARAHEFRLNRLPAQFLFLNGQFHCEFQSEARMDYLHTVLNTAIGAPPQEAP
jgi:thioredoxin 1